MAAPERMPGLLAVGSRSPAHNRIIADAAISGSSTSDSPVGFAGDPIEPARSTVRRQGEGRGVDQMAGCSSSPVDSHNLRYQRSLRLREKRAMVFAMRGIIAFLVLATFSPVFLTGQPASGAGKLITSPAEQETSPQDPAASQPTLKDIRPSGPPIVIGVSSGTLLHLPGAARQVFIADDEVANAQTQRELPQFVYVTAKKPGRTVLYAVDEAGHVLLNKVIEVSPTPVTIIRRAKIDTGEPPPPPNFLVLPLQPASTPTAPSESP